MKTSTCFIIALFILGCNQKNQPRSDFLELDDPLPKSAISLNKVMPSQNGESLSLFDYEYKGSHFSVGSNSQGKVKYILVKDSVYTTPEGIKLGDPGSKLNKIGNPMGRWYQGYYQVRLASGWVVQIEGGGTFNISGLVQHKHPIDTIVTNIFKLSGI